MWRSADFGDSWVKVGFDSPSYRGGVTLGQPQLTDSGEIQFVGLGSDTSGKVLFRERLTVSSGEWSGVERVEVAESATHVVAWPGLSSPVVGGSPLVGLVHGAAAPFEFRSVPVGWEADSSSVVAESSRSGVAFSLNGLVPSRQILSASGTWRIVEDRPPQTKQWLWRSPDGVNWERVTLPPIFSYSDPVAIGDDGAIVVARWSRSSTCCSDARAELYQFTDGWRGPFATVVAGSWRFGPRTVDVVGDQIVLDDCGGIDGRCCSGDQIVGCRSDVGFYVLDVGVVADVVADRRPACSSPVRDGLSLDRRLRFGNDHQGGHSVRHGDR